MLVRVRLRFKISLQPDPVFTPCFDIHYRVHTPRKPRNEYSSTKSRSRYPSRTRQVTCEQHQPLKPRSLKSTATPSCKQRRHPFASFLVDPFPGAFLSASKPVSLSLCLLLIRLCRTLDLFSGNHAVYDVVVDAREIR